MDTNVIKTGWKTTEFWVALVPQVLGALLVLGVITPEQNQVTATQANTLISAIAQAAGAIIAGLSAYGYAGSRARVKEASIIASASKG